MDWLSLVRILSRALLVITSLCYAYQVIYLFLPIILKKRPQKEEKLHRYAILIPARNEERVLPHLLESIQAQDYPRDLLKVFVVADNCTDGTAEAARAYGAHVFSRSNTKEVGKGYALNYLLSQIEETEGLDSYDSFLVFDADNLLQSDYITQINKVRSSGYEAFCGYRNTKNFGNSWVSAGYGVWYLHDSTHLNRSRMLIGSSCAVNGTGFGFTNELLQKCGGWNFFTLTEDIEFSTWCATHSIKVGYSHDAILYDEQPLMFSQSWKQRTRWVQGGIQIFLRCSGDLFRGIFKGGWTSYASFETATLSVWGYGLAILSGLSAFLLTILETGLYGLGWSLLLSSLGGYLSMFAMGALTVIMEWKRIRATTRQKIMSMFAFPMFMLSFLPIALIAPFRKFEWTPIEHTVAVSVEDVQC